MSTKSRRSTQQTPQGFVCNQLVRCLDAESGLVRGAVYVCERTTKRVAGCAIPGVKVYGSAKICPQFMFTPATVERDTLIFMWPVGAA